MAREPAEGDGGASRRRPAGRALGPAQSRRPQRGPLGGRAEVPDSWGQGLATESAQGALDWARETLGLTEVFAVVYAGNDPSMAVCRRLGMEHLGLTTNYYETELELFHVEL